MLWAPIVHTLSMNFKDDRLMRVSFGMSFTLVFGYLISWTSSSVLQTVFNWRTVFIIPSVIVAIFCLIWFLFFKENPDEFIVSDKTDEIKNDRTEKIKESPIYRNKGVMLLILFVVLGAIMHGVIKESINIWLPTMLENVKGFSMESTLEYCSSFRLLTFQVFFFQSSYQLKQRQTVMRL
jgi:sugar phosphate permease